MMTTPDAHALPGTDVCTPAPLLEPIEQKPSAKNISAAPSSRACNRAAFAGRLKSILAHDGYITDRAKRLRLAKTFGIQPATAARWLSGASMPRAFSERYWNGLEALRMPYEWVLLGEWNWKPDTTERQATIAGEDPSSVRLLAAYRHMTEWEQNKFLRWMIRIRNNDPKAMRLCELKDRGQISQQQLFEAM